jgi:hypothetical protein
VSFVVLPKCRAIDVPDRFEIGGAFMTKVHFNSPEVLASM